MRVEWRWVSTRVVMSASLRLERNREQWKFPLVWPRERGCVLSGCFSLSDSCGFHCLFCKCSEKGPLDHQACLYSNRHVQSHKHAPVYILDWKGVQLDVKCIFESGQNMQWCSVVVLCLHCNCPSSVHTASDGTGGVFLITLDRTGFISSQCT